MSVQGISKAQEYFDDMEKSETKIDWLAVRVFRLN